MIIKLNLTRSLVDCSVHISVICVKHIVFTLISFKKCRAYVRTKIAFSTAKIDYNTINKRIMTYRFNNFNNIFINYNNVDQWRNKGGEKTRINHRKVFKLSSHKSWKSS